MKNGKSMWLLVFAGLLLIVVPALGQEAEHGDETQPATPEGAKVATPSSMWFNDIGAAKLGAAIGCGLILMGGGAGIGRIGSAAAESMARQPEAAGSINLIALVLAAMIEGATLFAVVVCLLGVIYEGKA